MINKDSTVRTELATVQTDKDHFYKVESIRGTVTEAI